MSMIKHIFWGACLLLLLAPAALAQQQPGFIMIAGGGSEQAGGWSDAPYGWVVEKSQNKKVAIITFDSNPTTWIPDYFESLGAVRARNFIINTTQLADDQATYDSIIGYDAIFFKGGDQWNYYDTYKGTLLEDAVEYVFNNGGVLSGTSAGLHILSEVVFTAENGTVYSEEALEDPFNFYMTLENDFIPGFSGAVFDSHFAERGRLGRIIGFLGNRDLSEGDQLIGIGVDDKTAFCIDTNRVGTAHGTGAVNLYYAGSNNTFSISETRLLASDIEVSQLIDACTVDLNTMAINGFSDYTEPAFSGEDFAGHVFLSATNGIDDNMAFFQALAAYTSSAIVIITGYEQSLAQAVQTALQQEGVSSDILSTTPDTYNDPQWLEKLQQSSLFLFVGNELQVLKDFLEFGSNGQYLWEQVISGSRSCAFMGGDSRHAGKISVVNYAQDYASYDGELDLKEGLCLLQNTIVMPYVFSSDVDEENTVTAVPYAMAMHDLAYGMWMHGNTFAEVTRSGDDILIEVSGDCPVIFLENKGSAGGFANMVASSSGLPRNIAGFEKFTLRLLDHTTPLTLQNVFGIHEKEVPGLRFFPNPAADRLYVDGMDEARAVLKIHELSGRLLKSAEYHDGNGIRIDDLREGVYLVSVFRPGGEHLYTGRIVKTK
ncbi:MAG: T9SS type A sorting domain-containing protein [Bacteroidales bacterium]|jgi:cyanophycinase|nr:T9SS type A sorting domain-containing protein [Bacteroidales bacterium]